MNKGWIRIHIILSIVLGIIISLGIENPDFYWLKFFLTPLYWVLLYLIRFLIKWVKQGFKED